MERKQINREELSKFASNFLVALKRENLDSMGELEKKIEKIIPVEDGQITCEMRPSEGGTLSYTLSYIVPFMGIPIEVRVNQPYDYVRFIVKTIAKVEGYTPFAQDSVGNVIQDRKGFLSWEEIEGELSMLGRTQNA